MRVRRLAQDAMIGHAVVGPVARCERDRLLEKNALGVVVSGNGDVADQQVTDVKVALGLHLKPLAALGSGQPAVHPAVKAVERNRRRDVIWRAQPNKRIGVGLAVSGV